MHRGPGPPVDGLLHRSQPTHQVPQEGEDETLPGQVQVEGNEGEAKKHSIHHHRATIIIIKPPTICN